VTGANCQHIISSASRRTQIINTRIAVKLALAAKSVSLHCTIILFLRMASFASGVSAA